MQLVKEEMKVLASAVSMVLAAIEADYPKSPYGPNHDQAKAHLRVAEWAEGVAREQFRAAAAALRRPVD